MKHSDEWGNGRTVISDKRSQSYQTKSGGSGTIAVGGLSHFCLKEVFYKRKGGEPNNQFWNEAQSVSVYTSAARNIPGCVACPLPVSYWIWERDPLYINFPRRRMSEERPRALIDYISLFGVTSEQLRKEFGIDPATYWFVPPLLLKQIHKEKLSAHLLLAYPVLRGWKNLREIIEENRRKLTPEDGFLWERSLWNPSEVCKLIYHILSAILALYRNGLAHGDVKPQNIMRTLWGEEGYFLTDVGSVHSGSHPSDSVTKKFFSRTTFDTWNDELKLGKPNSGKPDYGKQNKKLIGDGGFRPETKLSAKQLNSLLRRTLTDGFALAVTIYSIAKGREPDEDVSLNLNLVEDKWHCAEITDIFNKLWNAQDLTIGKMQEIVDSLKGEFPPQFLRREPIKTYGRESEIRFDVKRVDKEEEKKEEEGSPKDTSPTFELGMKDKPEIQYGKLSEQLSFSEKFNPVMRVFDNELTSDFPSEDVMQPIIETYSNGGHFVNNIYYAPDDAESGCRPVNFKKYHPSTLDYLLGHSKVTEQDITKLVALGQRIDEYWIERKRRHRAIPYPNDVVKIDGNWMICPFFLKCRFLAQDVISIEEYFKMLCGKDNKLTPQNWADLLRFDHGVGILFELMPEKMIRPLAELLNAAAEIDPESVKDEAESSKINWNRFLRECLRETKKFGKYLSAE